MKKLIPLFIFLLAAHSAPAQSQNAIDNNDRKPSYAAGEAYIQVQADALMKYPQEALDKGIGGTVTVAFTVDEKGALHDIKVTEPIDPALDAEAVRIASLLTDWVPGSHDGKYVSMPSSAQITFDAQKYKTRHSMLFKKTPTTYPDKMPSPAFDLSRFLGENIVYPEHARRKNKQGRAILKFVVNEDGSITDVQIVKSAGNDELDEEAMRVIGKMPKWHPGMLDGKPVKVYFTQPITFKLE